MKKILKKLLSCCIFVGMFLLIFLNTAFAQLPDDDPTWQLVFEDEFDSTAVSINDWYQIWGWNQGSYIRACHGDTIFAPNFGYRTWDWYHDTMSPFPNCKMDSNILKIISKEESYWGEIWEWPNGQWFRDTIPFDYTTGMLKSQNRFRFGYFEVNCKLPVPQNPGETNTLGPNFWLWAAGDSISAYSEIDIFEFNGLLEKHNPDTSIVNYLTSNWHYRECKPGDTTCNGDTTFHHFTDYINHSLGGVDFTDFHEFSVDWTEKGITYFMDGIPYYISNNGYAGRMSPMSIILDINHPAHNFCDTAVAPETSFPYEFEIDFVRVWQLKQYCDSVINLCSFDPATYDFAIYKNIMLGGSSCTPTIDLGEHITFRATDGILLDKGFTVELGAEFLAETTPCQEQFIGHYPHKNPPEPPPQDFIDIHY